jgi:hypothetical protein
MEGHHFAEVEALEQGIGRGVIIYSAVAPRRPLAGGFLKVVRVSSRPLERYLLTTNLDEMKCC